VQQTLTFQPGKTALGIVPILAHGFQTGYRTPPVEDKDRFAVPHLVDERAQVVLCIGQGDSLHLARIAIHPFPLETLSNFFHRGGLFPCLALKGRNLISLVL